MCRHRFLLLCFAQVWSLICSCDVHALCRQAFMEERSTHVRTHTSTHTHTQACHAHAHTHANTHTCILFASPMNIELHHSGSRWLHNTMMQLNYLSHFQSSRDHWDVTLCASGLAMRCLLHQSTKPCVTIVPVASCFRSCLWSAAARWWRRNS